MIIAKSKRLAPGQEDLVMTLDCRVSYFWGAKALSFLLIYSILTPVSLDLAKRFNLNPRSWLAVLIFLGQSFWAGCSTIAYGNVQSPSTIGAKVWKS